MKAGILTFHASHNYGSMLQAYALQKVLSQYGVENEIINFRSSIQKSLIPPPVSMRHPRSSLRKFISEPDITLALLSKYRRFEKFLRHDLTITCELSTPSQVAEFVKDAGYDAIITGSDQIWNPGCWDFDMTYLCDFPFSGKRIAYAPSLGSHPEQISSDDIVKMVRALEKYDMISTREVRGKEYLSRYINKSVEVVLDPTLLLCSEDYFEIANETVNISESYIFYYTPREESGFFGKAIELAELTGMKIVVTQDYPEYKHKNIIRILDCGPREFLSIIRNASYTIGNSFHLLAFSLIFGKEFYLLSNGADSRMMNILTSLGLQARLNMGENMEIMSPIDYAAVESVMLSARSKSLNYLYSALKK